MTIVLNKSQLAIIAFCFEFFGVLCLLGGLGGGEWGRVGWG